MAMAAAATRSGSACWGSGVIFYTNGIMTEKAAAEEFCETLSGLTGSEVRLHYNGTTPTMSVVEFTTLVGAAGLAGGIGLYGLSDEERRKKKEQYALVLLVAAAFVYWAHNSYDAIQERKKDSAHSLSQKIIAHLTTHPFNEVMLVLHSQGVEIGEWALGEVPRVLQRRIKVAAMGGKVDIPSVGLKKVVNFENRDDLIARFAKVFSDSRPGSKVVERTQLAACATAACHGAADYLATPAVTKTIKAMAWPACGATRPAAPPS